MKKKLKQAKAVAKAQVARSNAIGTPTRTVVNFTLPLSSKAKDAAFRPEKAKYTRLSAFPMQYSIRQSSYNPERELL